jgi:hypothetical protein
VSVPEQPRRPEVRLTGSSAPVGPSVDDAVARPPRRPLLLLLVPLALLLVAVALPAAPAFEARPAEPPPTLVLLPDQLSVTQGGVLVVPVELRNPGAALQVRSAGAYAEPVREDPVLQAPERVEAGAQRRFVVLVAPDCRLLQPGSPLRFQASLLLKIARGSAVSDVLLDVASEPAVRDTVVSLCRR